MEEEEEEIRRNGGAGITKMTTFSLVSLPALPFSVIFRVFWMF